jgi:hypothetical protein
MIRSNVVVNAEERHKRALDAAGRFRSGLRDLSTEHDKYLEEAFSEVKIKHKEEAYIF